MRWLDPTLQPERRPGTQWCAGKRGRPATWGRGSLALTCLHGSHCPMDPTHPKACQAACQAQAVVCAAQRNNRPPAQVCPPVPGRGIASQLLPDLLGILGSTFLESTATLQVAPPAAGCHPSETAVIMNQAIHVPAAMEGMAELSWCCRQRAHYRLHNAVAAANE